MIRSTCVNLDNCFSFVFKFTENIRVDIIFDAVEQFSQQTFLLIFVYLFFRF